MNETMDPARLGSDCKLRNTKFQVVRRYMYKNHKSQLETAKWEFASAPLADQDVLQAAWLGLCSGT